MNAEKRVNDKLFVAGAEGLEPSTNGFGVHYSTI